MQQQNLALPFIEMHPAPIASNSRFEHLFRKEILAIDTKSVIYRATTHLEKTLSCFNIRYCHFHFQPAGRGPGLRKK